MPFCSEERNGFVNFGGEPYQGHLCEIILNLSQQYRSGRIF